MLRTRLLNALFTLAILAGLVMLFCFVWPRLARLRSPPHIQTTPDILLEVQTLSQLVTVKYVMEKVVICDDPSMLSFLPLGESRVVLVAHGIVKAGINLADIKKEDIQISKNKITLKLPPAHVTDHYLDDKLTQVVDYKKGLLRSYNKDLEQNARAEAVLDIARAAREGGILKDADERARTQLTILFKHLGYDEVEFRPPDAAAK